ncbi:hypothetical protein PGT21_030323 [Puccinia graminis f. sp. tritici]|uniref:Uncharacterized protein n=1 Tax=Puccinia graminis f. sp. tritici TaxID=56615 RepID=A0A5B0QCB2_PUCGR|nr:hypothetical protein PGT21_029249 [Puccinia graminis f. sp. tritici]KAA1110722.1 hypothetical protein PGT21_030323 [Puccinia graminis f. sp. tritici]
MRCISHPPPSPAATLSTATTLKNKDIKNVQDHDGHHHHHPATDYCAQPNHPNQGYFRISESDNQWLRLLETQKQTIPMMGWTTLSCLISLLGHCAL